MENGWWKYVKQSLTIIITIGTVIVLIFGLVTFIDWRIEKKISEREFVEKVAEKVQRPSVIFDEKVSYLWDGGALKYIDEIKVDIKEEGHRKIVVTPKEFLPRAPILECLDEKIIFRERRGINCNWVYEEEKWVQSGGIFQDGSGPPVKWRFRLEIVR